jgi:transposase-like protein
MPKPLPEEKRAAILEDIQAGEKSRNQIARDHGVSVSTVTGIAKAEGLTEAFDRSRTEKATRAKAVDVKALREQLKLDLLEDAQRLRRRAWSPYQVVVSTPQGADVVTIDEPPLGEARAAYTAIGIAIDKSLVLEKHDSTGGDSGAGSMLDALAEGIRRFAQSNEPPAAESEGSGE